MSNNNHNNSSCACAEQTVSYLYGEANAQEKLKFETHLKNCPTCADELAAFGFVRSAVFDWRVAEFSKLPTPAFNIPSVEYKELLPAAGVSNGNRSWLADFRQMFSFNPMRTAAAFGVLIVCAGIAWFALNFSGGKETAEIGDDKNLIQVAASPTVEIVKESEEKNVAVESDVKSSSPDIANSPQQIKRKAENRANKPIVRVSSDSPRNNFGGSARNQMETNEGGKKIAVVQKKQIPNLNDAEDEEDETIRLADLFDELDAK